MSKLFFRFRHQAAHAEDWVLFEGLAIRVLEAKALVARKTGHATPKCRIVLRMFDADGRNELDNYSMLPRNAHVVLRRSPVGGVEEALTPASARASAADATPTPHPRPRPCTQTWRARRGIPAGVEFAPAAAPAVKEVVDTRHPGDILADWLTTSFAGLRI